MFRHLGTFDTTTLPTKGHPGDVGHDLYVTVPTRIDVGCVVKLRHDVAVDLPHNTWAQILPRSSTILEHGLIVVPGVVDPFYSGELATGVVNVSGKPVELKAGTRVSQLVMFPVAYNDRMSDYDEDIVRGSNGFGSTGV